jgi:hypothetical protein
MHLKLQLRLFRHLPVKFTCMHFGSVPMYICDEYAFISYLEPYRIMCRHTHNIGETPMHFSVHIHRYIYVFMFVYITGRKTFRKVFLHGKVLESGKLVHWDQGNIGAKHLEVLKKQTLKTYLLSKKEKKRNRQN